MLISNIIASIIDVLRCISHTYVYFMYNDYVNFVFVTLIATYSVVSCSVCLVSIKPILVYLSPSLRLQSVLTVAITSASMCEFITVVISRSRLQ